MHRCGCLPLAFARASRLFASTGTKTRLVAARSGCHYMLCHCAAAVTTQSLWPLSFLLMTHCLCYLPNTLVLTYQRFPHLPLTTATPPPHNSPPFHISNPTAHHNSSLPVPPLPPPLLRAYLRSPTMSTSTQLRHRRCRCPQSHTLWLEEGLSLIHI